MKRMIFMLGAVAALCSCSKEEPAQPLPNGVAIVPTAGVQASEADEKTLTRADLPAGPVTTTAFPANTTKVFAVTATSGTGSEPSNLNTTYFANQAVNSGASSKLSFATAQYFPVNAATKLWFYAYSPIAGASGTTSVAWTIDGQKDIMWAKAGPCNKAGAQPAFSFVHKLMKVQFIPIAGTGFTSTTTKVTAIKIKSVNKSVTLNLKDGATSFGTSGDLTFPVSGNNTVKASNTTPMDGCLMFQPVTSFSAEVTTSDGVTYPVSVTVNGVAGSNYKVKLNFTPKEITATASVAAWGSVTQTGDITVGPGNIQ